MKQKTSGLHVGKYREKPNFKTNLAATILPAVLIFCALAGLFLTATGSTSLLPLFASGLVCFALFAAAKPLPQRGHPAARCACPAHYNCVFCARSASERLRRALERGARPLGRRTKRFTPPCPNGQLRPLAGSNFARPPSSPHSALPFRAPQLWPQRCSSSSPSRQASFISRRGFSCRRELRFCCWRGRKIPFPQSTFSCSAQLCLELPH